MTDYSKEKFKVGDHVSFNIYGTELIGKGIVGGKVIGGLLPMWAIIITERDTDYMKNIPELVLIVQETTLKKEAKN